MEEQNDKQQKKKIPAKLGARLVTPLAMRTSSWFDAAFRAEKKRKRRSMKRMTGRERQSKFQANQNLAVRAKIASHVPHCVAADVEEDPVALVPLGFFVVLDVVVDELGCLSSSFASDARDDVGNSPARPKAFSRTHRHLQNR